MPAPKTLTATKVKASTRRIAAAAKSNTAAKNQAPVALRLTIDVDPLLNAVRKHVRLSPDVARIIRGDFQRLLQVRVTKGLAVASKVEAGDSADPVLSTQEAADLAGVSRPYLVARIDAGDIPLHQQVGNQRRVLKSAVLKWHRQQQGRRQRALTQLGVDLDNELFSS
jgi:excisionase family DNA binding protein